MSRDLEKNITQCHRALKRYRENALAHFINGEPVLNHDHATFGNYSPVANESLGEVSAGGSVEIEQAAQAAHRAFHTWRDTPGSTRKKILLGIADLIETRSQEIALLESIDTGQPLRFMSKAAIRGAENFRFFADRAVDAGNGLSLPAAEHINYTTRQPIGPVGVITPWNTPFMLSTWKIAPALAAGCTVVHKPAEWSPITASLLAEICDEAGLPPGVLNVVHGDGEQAGKSLTEHPLIKAIAFVGESSTGAAIMAQGAPSLKRLHAELGGKNPVIVFDDADLEQALDAVVFMIYSLNGERCTSSSRVLVHESIYAAFTAGIEKRARALNVGHPLDPAVEVGPLIHANHLNKVMGYFDIAQSDGATIATGGKAWAGDVAGHFVEPTLFTGANQTMRVAREEIFGPVLTAIPFTTEEEAARIANDIDYGLAAYVWTKDIGRGHRLARDLDVGMVWINSENNRHLPSPFGGMKASGIGRDGGDYSFDFYMETKNVCVALGTHKVPSLGAN